MMSAERWKADVHNGDNYTRYVLGAVQVLHNLSNITCEYLVFQLVSHPGGRENRFEHPDSKG